MVRSTLYKTTDVLNDVVLGLYQLYIKCIVGNALIDLVGSYISIRASSLLMKSRLCPQMANNPKTNHVKYLNKSWE